MKPYLISLWVVITLFLAIATHHLLIKNREAEVTIERAAELINHNMEELAICAMHEQQLELQARQCQKAEM